MRRALREAEDRRERRRTAERTTRLRDLEVTLAGALTRPEVARAVAEAGLEALAADGAAVWLRPGAEEDPGFALAARAGALAEGARAELAADEPVLAAALAPTPETAPAEDAGALWRGAAVVAPLPVRLADATLGVLALAWRAPRALDAGDRELALGVARICAQALDRARLYETEREASRRFALLARASEMLAASLDYETTLNSIASLAMPMLADFCFFDLREDDGAVRRLARAHANPRTGALLAGTRWARSERRDINTCALSTGETAFHPRIDDAWMIDVATSPGHLEAMRTLDFCSMISVPLRSQGETIGALTLCHAESRRHHTRLDVELAEEIARRAATAVENARLYALAQRERARAEAASRAKDEFLAMVSHELRTPLTAILGWSRMLQTGAFEEEKRGRALQTIERNARAQARIIDDLLDVARIVSGKLRLERERFELVRVLESALDAIRPFADAKGIRIEARLGPEVLLDADPARVAQIASNLLTNAVKFTPAGGEVTLSLRRPPGGVEIVVDDTGQGIAPEVLPRIFERFSQGEMGAARTHGGLGLGLAIVRHLVELHGGTISAESHGAGRGATLTVWLPGDAAIVPAGAGARDEGETTSLAGWTALVVDDEPDTRELVAAMLERAGATVTCAPGAAPALFALGAGAADVLVSDLGMPGETGYDLVRKLRALPAGARTAAVALTAFARVEDRERALEAGFDAHLPKPVDAADLVRAVLEALRARGRGT